MRVTDKGQVTIPKHIREQAGLRAGTEVAFRFEDGVVIMEQVRENPDDAEASPPLRGRAGTLEPTARDREQRSQPR